MDRFPRVRLALRPGWSTKNFDVVMAARVAMSAGRALAGVVAPIYLAIEGFDALELSAYVLVVAAAAALMSTTIGLSADRIGRRPFMVATPLLTALAGVAFALTGAHLVLFIMGALGSFGRGAGAGAGAVGPYQPAESAFVSETVSARDRNAAFGRLAFGSSAGATIGGLLALLVPSAHVSPAAALGVFRPAFLAITAVSAFAGLIALALTEDPDGRAARTRPRVRLPARSRWLLYRLWVTNTFNGAAIGMFGPFVTYWFYRRFGVGAGEIGTLFAVINIATMASTLSAAGLARRWGLVRTVSAVRTAQALLLIPMVLAPSFEIAGAIYLLRMLVQRVGLPLRQSYVVGLADPGERASLAALSNVPSQLAMAGSPLLTGYLFEEVSLTLPFEIAAGLQFVNAATFWFFFRHHPPEEELPPAAAGPGGRRDDQAPVSKSA
jgi:predicted MFS family arabinose efflux permease